MSSNSTFSPPAGRYDYHVHPDYSVDAEGSIDDYCRTAVERGIAAICFTTHLDTEPAAPNGDRQVYVRGALCPVDGPWVETYLADIASAAAKYAPLGLAVRAGLEIGFHAGVVERLGPLVQAYPFDFVLGSVHLVGPYALSYAGHVADMFRVRGAEAGLTDYFAHVERAARCGLFDCLGHLDLYRRTLGVKVEEHLAQGRVRDAAMHALAAAADAGVGIEINTSNGARGREYLSPGPALLEMALAAGVKVITTGSDAHLPAVLGAGLDVGVAEASRAGAAAIATFVGRKAQLHPLAGVAGSSGGHVGRRAAGSAETAGKAGPDLNGQLG